jgi:hypothetical protein
MDYEKDCSRRDFLKTTGAAGLGLLTAATVPQTLGAQESGRVPTRPFGKTGDQVAILSLGGMFDIPSNQLTETWCHPLKGLPIKGVVKRKNTSPSGLHTQNPVAPRH